MKRYIDGYVIPVPKKKLDAYKKMAQAAAKTWIKYGALEYFEYVGEDLNPDLGGAIFTSFAKLTKLKPSETVIFAYIVYRSRAHRDKVNAKVVEDHEMNELVNEDTDMPFDMKRMAFGGFESLVGKITKK